MAAPPPSPRRSGRDGGGGPAPAPPPATTTTTATVATTKPSRRLPRIVTLPLLRKRSEHNEGLVSSLEELALHQEELQSIGPILGRTCGKTLRILLLQNNVVDRMHPSELKFFVRLEYLNLALNNLAKIEGLGSMERLRKLDLTLNFVDVDELEESAAELAGCPGGVEELYLAGNPCMGIGDDGGVPADDDGSFENGDGDNHETKQKAIGWPGCRAYLVARLPRLRILDGREVKRSERILATQRLPTLTAELRSLAAARREARKVERGDRARRKRDANGHDEEGRDEGVGEAEDDDYLPDDAPTRHDPATRLKLSHELHDQKAAKEEREGTNRPPDVKGEKEWEEEHRDAVRKAREREERFGPKTSVGSASGARRDNDCNDGEEGGEIKQCNQGKYRFWFEEEDGHDGASNSLLVLRVSVPRHLSTSLVDVDVHPSYVSVVIKTKLVRVKLPAEVRADRSVARRSAATGALEVRMPKVDPNAVAIEGSGREKVPPREGGRGGTGGKSGGVPGTHGRCDEGRARPRRERLGFSMMKEAGEIDPLRIVPNEISDSESNALGAFRDDEDDDEPPPLH